MGTALGNLLETYIGFVLLKRYKHFNPALTHIRDLLGVVVLGALLAPLASAMVGPMSMLAAGMISPPQLLTVMWRWWRGDVLGIAFLTPLTLLFAKNRPYFSERVTLKETALLWVGALFTGQMIFMGWMLPGIVLERAPELGWTFPFLFWAGLRTGRRNTALIQMLFMVQSMASAYLNIGFFSHEFANYGLTNFWFAAVMLSVAGLSLAILTDERRKALLQITLHAKVYALSSDGVVIVNAHNKIVSVNPSFTRITGYSAREVIGQNPRIYASGQHDQSFYQTMWNMISEKGRWDGEIWNRRKNGELFLEKLSIQTIKDADGRIVNHLGIFADITESRAAQDAVAHQAQHDFLTNLPNRLLFTDRFQQQLALARRNNTKFGLIYLDLDGFKAINDTHGHPVGDELLITVAQRMSTMVREIDTVCRFGGDEFAVLVSNVLHKSDVTAMADKLLDALVKPYALKAHTVRVTASLGLAIYPNHGHDMDTLVRAADDALLQAKEDGKNAWQFSAFGITTEEADEWARNESGK
jgi:diguanylate cyclase (GGDEF)-like protein/PAS domain S-box-containing protein